MRFFAITAAILAVLATAFLALPFVNIAAALDVQAPVAEDVAFIAPASAAAIPVTDLTGAAPDPLQIADHPAETIQAVSAAEPEIDVLAELAAAQAAAEAVARQAQQAQQAHLEEFIASVTNGYSSIVTGVYVPELIALPVGQQPSGNAGFITTKEDSATQFSLASSYGAIGILAHNYLAGEQFFQLGEGMQVYVVFGDGSYDIYRITGVRRFQALQPNSPYSNFRDVETDALLSAAQLFDQVYNQPGKLIFQTCIESDGINTWGRLFITAEVVE